MLRFPRLPRRRLICDMCLCKLKKGEAGFMEEGDDMETGEPVMAVTCTSCHNWLETLPEGTEVTPFILGL